MNAALLAVGEDSEASNYEDCAPVMAGTIEENEEDEVFILSLQLEVTLPLP